METSRTGNYLRKVSCRGEAQWSHAGQETVCERFPVEMKRNGAMPERKLPTFCPNMVQYIKSICVPGLEVRT